MKSSLGIIVTVAIAGLSQNALAGVTVYTTQTAFNTALSASGLTLMGTEAWNAAGGVTFLNDPLAPGFANGPFPTGTPLGMGMTVQSNTLGSSPSTTSPRGANGLIWYPAGSAGVSGNLQPSDQLSPNNAGDSFDMLFTTVAGTSPRMIDFTPTYYRILSLNNTATLNVQIYDAGGAFVFSELIGNVADCLESAYRGFQFTGSTTLGRINVSVLTAVGQPALDTASADNIRLYGSPVPEPASLAAFGFGVWAFRQRRRR